MGVPVVALAGPSIVSRITPSILSAMQMPEWIARSDEEYVRIAVQAARDLPGLRACVPSCARGWPDRRLAMYGATRASRVHLPHHVAALVRQPGGRLRRAATGVARDGARRSRHRCGRWPAQPSGHCNAYRQAIEDDRGSRRLHMNLGIALQAARDLGGRSRPTRRRSNWMRVTPRRAQPGHGAPGPSANTLMQRPISAPH